MNTHITNTHTKKMEFNTLVMDLENITSGYEDDSLNELNAKLKKLKTLNPLTSEFLTTEEPQPYPNNGRPTASTENFLDCSPYEAQGFLEAEMDSIECEIERRERIKS